MNGENMTIEWYEPAELNKAVVGCIQYTDIVLDLGCGIRPQSFFRPMVHICCEPYSEYLNLLKEKYKGENYILVQQTAHEFLSYMPDKSVDSIFMLDFIEHVDKQTGLNILAECDRVARSQIIIFTPLGFLAQEYEKDDLDGWGMHGTQWQEHKSGWEPVDFDNTWRLFASENYHQIVNGRKLDHPHGALWAIKNIGEFSESSETIEQITNDFIGNSTDSDNVRQMILMIYKTIRDANQRFEAKTMNHLAHIETELSQRELLLHKYENNVNALFDRREGVISESFELRVRQLLEREKVVAEREKVVAKKEEAFANKEKAFAKKETFFMYIPIVKLYLYLFKKQP